MNPTTRERNETDESAPEDPRAAGGARRGDAPLPPVVAVAGPSGAWKSALNTPTSRPASRS
ncbi:hypothetical protein, partial [Halorubrum sp. SS7]|uniref:hypothetical protein n=1 Tax=Halorubrum sp. SS7 TaxID=2518119 RepID=UPI001A7E0C26